MLSPITINEIIKKFGKEIRYPSDYQELAYAIEKEVKKQISVNTIKRMLGNIKKDTEPRLYTLDIIAEYLGYKNWDDYIPTLKSVNYSEFKLFNGIGFRDLKINDQLEFHYYPDRKVLIEKVEKFLFRVMKSENSQLKEKDLLHFDQMILNHPLFILQIIRDGTELGGYVAGKVGGITFFKHIPYRGDVYNDWYII